MVLNNLVPLPTHSLSVLIETLESHGIVIPDDVKAAVALSYYAVQHDIPAIMNPLKNMNTFRRSQWHGRLSHGLKAGFSGGDIPGNMTQCSFAHPAASSTATITSIRASVTRKGVMGRAAVKRNYLNSNVSSLR
jgi:hypothetical protein